ncbi:FOG: WD40-like repeat [Hahella chejuensis KCTC 2396]|uniref:FOG: WD40-like repeat n=1 Tax=Hahella chejuensis (strain KCTC 2396) TaxID=349521 RepID=Q2SB03_HAHCH|nr:PQQ-binding-like beta-propeller repeat protein [Hahella chejuensis]ABC32171.1 FOG: WD40-like repeat [Hahella chejuensis KCTC 2396]
MFGLTEMMELSASSNTLSEGYQYAIVPTVLLPLAFLGTALSVVATFIAGMFGVKLKAEGPKKLLELLLKPKVLLAAVALNLAIYGGYLGVDYVKNGPVPQTVQKLANSDTTYHQKAMQGDRALWKQSLEGEGIFARGTIVNGELFFGTNEGYLYVADADTGALKNKLFFGKFLSPSPTLYKGFLYFGEGLHQSHSMGVYKFDPEKKQVVSHFRTNGHTEIFPVFTNSDGKDYLLQTAGEDGLYAINPDTMEKIWQFKGGHMDGFALVQGDYVYIGSGIPREGFSINRPFAYKLNLKDGSIVWKKELPLSAWYGPVQVQDDVCFIQGEIHIDTHVGGLSCFTQAGERAHSLVINYPVVGKPIVKNDTIYFNDYYGNLYAWDAINNKLKWEIESEIKKGAYSSLQFYNEKEIIYAKRTGGVLIINMESGEVRENIDFAQDELIYADPLVKEDAFYLFGMKGSIFKSAKI